MKAQMLVGRKDGQQMLYILNRLLALDAVHMLII